MTGKEQTVCRLDRNQFIQLFDSTQQYLLVRFQQIESRWGYSGTSDKIRSAQALNCLNSPSLFIFFRFIVDRRIFVVGFGLYGSIHGPSEYFTYFTTFHPHLLVSGMMWPSSWYTPALAGSLGQMKFHSPGESFEERLRFSVMEMNVISDGTNATFRAMFKEPLEIQPNTNYTAVSFTPLQHLKVKVKELIEIGLIFYHYQVSTLKGLDSHYGTKGLRKVAFTISLFSLHCKLNGTCAGDGWLSQWRQGDISVQLRGGQQQWHLRGRRTDSRDYFLYLSSPVITWLVQSSRIIADVIRLLFEAWRISTHLNMSLCFLTPSDVNFVRICFTSCDSVLCDVNLWVRSFTRTLNHPCSLICCEIFVDLHV